MGNPPVTPSDPQESRGIPSKCENCTCGQNKPICHPGNSQPSTCHPGNSHSELSGISSKKSSVDASLEIPDLVRDDKKVDRIEVCDSKTCGPKHARYIMQELENHFGIKEGQESEEVSLQYRGCLGYCEVANNIAVNGNIISEVIPPEAASKVEAARKLPEGDYTKGEFEDLELGDDLFLGL